MKFSLLIALLFSFSTVVFAKSSETLTFDPAMYAEMKNKNLGEFFCAKPATYFLTQACDELKSKSISVDWKTPKFSKTYFTISHGKREIKVSRTAQPTVYEINSKKIDITNYENFAALLEGIGKMLPKTAHYSLFVNAANAAEAESFSNPEKSLLASIGIILSASSDTDICKAAASLTRACGGIAENMTGTKGLMDIVLRVEERMSGAKNKGVQAALDAGMRPEERKEFDSYVSAIATQSAYLSEHLEKMQSKEAVLAKCPSQKKGKSAWSDISECKAKVANAGENVRSLPTFVLPMLRGTNEDLAKVMEAKRAVGLPPKGEASGTAR